MKLLLWCALSASLQGTAVEAVYDEQKWLPTLGPNFDAAVTQVEALSYVASISKPFLGVCSDPDIHTVPKECHNELVGVLSKSKELDRNATRACQVTCDGIDHCIEPCKKAMLGVAYGRWEADRKILMTYLGIKQTPLARLGSAVSNVRQGMTGPEREVISFGLLTLIHCGSMVLSFKVISNDYYRLVAFYVCFAAYFVEMCLFCPYMVIMLTTLIMWFLFCDWIFGFKHLSEDEADDLGFLEDCKRVITRVVYTLAPLAAAVVVACAFGL
mgnify:CR=1 FL=1